MENDDMTEYEFEHTDTFGGEANYCWVNRGTVMARSLDHAVRLAKAACGLTGVRCKREEYSGVGGAILRPCGWAQIMFVTYKES